MVITLFEVATIERVEQYLLCQEQYLVQTLSFQQYTKDYRWSIVSKIKSISIGILYKLPNQTEISEQKLGNLKY